MKNRIIKFSDYIWERVDGNAMSKAEYDSLFIPFGPPLQFQNNICLFTKKGIEYKCTRPQTKNIDILVVATNKYVQFLPKLIASLTEKFLPNENRIVHVFTDRVKDCELLLSQETIDIELHEIEHDKWPYATLYRFHFFQRYITSINGDYQYYIDADSVVMSYIGADILSPRTAVQHCGFVNGGGSWETRIHSRSYVPKSLQKTYYGGGFWGFDKNNFSMVVERAVGMIDEDIKNGITPVWHDESVLNAILSSAEPTKVLTPSYHYPENNPRIWESWNEKYECKILLLDKNHKSMRT